MSGNRKRRLEAQAIRGEGDDPFMDPDFWEAWHNPPCPEIEEHQIEAFFTCHTPGKFIPLEGGDTIVVVAE